MQKDTGSNGKSDNDRVRERLGEDKGLLFCGWSSLHLATLWRIYWIFLQKLQRSGNHVIEPQGSRQSHTRQHCCHFHHIPSLSRDCALGCGLFRYSPTFILPDIVLRYLHGFEKIAIACKSVYCQCATYHSPLPAQTPEKPS